MDKIKFALACLAVLALFISFSGQALPIYGLSTLLGTIIIISTTLITTTIVSTTIISSVLMGSNATVLLSPYFTAYNTGIYMAQILIALGTIASLIYIELTNPHAVGKVSNKALELRKVLLPFASIAVLIFFITFIVKVILAL